MARYYASRTGRFMTPDPGHVGANVSDPQSWNAYVYSRNDPVNFTDPSGLCWVDESGNFHEDEGFPCAEAIKMLISVTTDFLEWVPCFSIETGEPAGDCTGIGAGGLSPWNRSDPDDEGSSGGGGGGGGGITGGGTASPSDTTKNPLQPCVGGFKEPTATESLAILAAGERHIGAGYLAIGKCTGFVCMSIRESLNEKFQKNGIVADVIKNPALKLIPTGSQRAGDVMVFGHSHMGFYNPNTLAKDKTRTVLSAQGTPDKPGRVQYGSPTWFNGTVTYYRVYQQC